MVSEREQDPHSQEKRECIDSILVLCQGKRGNRTSPGGEEVNEGLTGGLAYEEPYGVVRGLVRQGNVLLQEIFSNSLFPASCTRCSSIAVLTPNQPVFYLHGTSSSSFKCSRCCLFVPFLVYPGKDISNVVTQSMLVRFLHEHIDQFADIADKTVADLNLGTERSG